MEIASYGPLFTHNYSPPPPKKKNTLSLKMLEREKMGGEFEEEG